MLEDKDGDGFYETSKVFADNLPWPTGLIDVTAMTERPDVELILAGEYAWKNDFARDVIDRLQAQGLAGRIRFMRLLEEARVDDRVRPAVLHKHAARF